MAHVIGVDGAPGGWAIVEMRGERLAARFVAKFKAVFEGAEPPAIVAVDMPIGLAAAYQLGGRACEREARRLLGRPRASSVFATPARPVLAGRHDYWEACRISRESAPAGKAISRQTFNILPKIGEIDALLQVRPELRAIVREVHPEVCFAELSGAPMRHAKKTPDGKAERLRALEAVFADIGALVASAGQMRLPLVDLMDATAACWTASRLARGEARSLVTPIPSDATGLSMTIWV